MSAFVRNDPSDFAPKLWARDASLWTGANEGEWLGWLDAVDRQLARAAEFSNLSREVKERNFSDAVLLGVGVASLGPAALWPLFGRSEGLPRFHVLDPTDPLQIEALRGAIDMDRSLFIVSSTSGTARETNLLTQHFFELANNALHFIAITDPGSELERQARELGFWKIFYGQKHIGQRYSVLSDFGMVPAAVMGIDVPRFLESAQTMVVCCKERDVSSNPGVQLGMALGQNALLGRDKVTLVMSPAISDLGAWIEQLLAGSNGKKDRGVVPVDREALGSPDVYGTDRLFIYVRYVPGPDGAQETSLNALEHTGHTVVRVDLADRYDIGQEFFRWEFAASVAASLLETNPFEEPDGTDSEHLETLPPEKPIFESGNIQLFTNERNAADLGTHASLDGYVAAHLQRLVAGDYFALLAYVANNRAHESALQAMRTLVRDKRRVATCVGFGPRFLDSTGQLYLAGPNSGVFLQITCDHAADVPVPEQKRTFGAVNAAQARASFDALSGKRRALRVHVSIDLEQGLETLHHAIQAAA